MSAPELRRQRLGELDRALAGEAARREAQLVELGLDGGDHVRMRVADVVHVVAVEVHVAAAGHVLDVRALGLADRRQAGRRHRLVQEGGAVARQQCAARLVEVLALPGRAARRVVDVAFALRRTGGARCVLPSVLPPWWFSARSKASKLRQRRCRRRALRAAG